MARHFLDSFGTPFWNHREDEYGDSYENRMRYPLQIIRAVREAVGPDFAIGARMTFDEGREGRFQRAEALRIAEDITAAGIDFISLINGSIGTDDHGGNQALDAVEARVRAGAAVDIVTPERTLSPDVGSLTASGYVNSLAEKAVTATVPRRLYGVTKTPQGLEAELGPDGFAFREELGDAVFPRRVEEPLTHQREPYRASMPCLRPGHQVPQLHKHVARHTQPRKIHDGIGDPLLISRTFVPAELPQSLGLLALALARASSVARRAGTVPRRGPACGP